jgi:hypothetical protein
VEGTVIKYDPKKKFYKIKITEAATEPATSGGDPEDPEMEKNEKDLAVQMKREGNEYAVVIKGRAPLYAKDYKAATALADKYQSLKPEIKQLDSVMKESKFSGVQASALVDAAVNGKDLKGLIESIFEDDKCWHEYRWEKNNKVKCIKCGKTKVIKNPDFLNRIKQRSSVKEEKESEDNGCFHDFRLMSGKTAKCLLCGVEIEVEDPDYLENLKKLETYKEATKEDDTVQKAEVDVKVDDPPEPPPLLNTTESIVSDLLSGNMTVGKSMSKLIVEASDSEFEDVIEKMADDYGLSNTLRSVITAYDKSGLVSDKMKKHIRDTIEFISSELGESRKTIDDKDAFSNAVSKMNLADAISIVSNVAGYKSEHLRANWQDDESSAVWTKIGNKLDKLSAIASKEKLETPSPFNGKEPAAEKGSEEPEEKPVEEGWNGEDELDRTNALVDAIGSVRADRLMQIYNDSYPSGTQYDKTMKTGQYHSKEAVFRSRAKQAGYTDKEIKMFLSI